MRVIEQARLWFREGNSDKVYEIDLVEVAAGQHVVNFRYGRRGGPLKDGTKTPLPLSLDKARGVYKKLVDEKVAGGYQTGPVTAAPAPAPVASGSPYRSPPVVHTPSVAQQLIGKLRMGARSPSPLGPVMWRVADLDLTEAEPVVLELLASQFVPTELEPNAWRHLLVAALARMGSAAAVTPLANLITDARTPRHLVDVARIAIARIDPVRSKEIALQRLPQNLSALYTRGDGPALARAVEEALTSDPMKVRDPIVALYAINDAVARPAVLAVARVARLSNVEAAIVRTLFRLAEIRRDGELYALIARRIDAHRGHTRPFSPLTRNYLRRRVARYLRRLGHVESADYVPMAAAILLGYEDDDTPDPKRGVFNHTYDRYAAYHAFNQILFTHSSRYEKSHHELSVWRVKGRYRPGDPPPPEREEAFPALWDRAPATLWELILKSGATPVLEFATRALRANHAFTQALRDDQLALVMSSGHLIAQRFAFDIARQRSLNVTLARGALSSDLPEAHNWVVTWIDANPEATVGDPDMLAMIVTGKTQAVREATLRLLRARPIADDIARSASVRAIAILLGLGDTPANAERASGAVATLLRSFEAQLREVSAEVLRDMLKHPLAALGELAGELVLRHAHRDTLPVDLIETMLASKFATVRTLGGRVLAATPPEVAKDDLEALVMFATSGNAELREATRTLLGEVAKRYPDVGRTLADRLIDALLKTQPPGAPAHIVTLLKAELAPVLPQKPAQTILRLIGALSPHARDAGGLLLHQLAPDDIGLDDIARLASHENLSVRQGAWALARASVSRYRIAPVALAKLLDSDWEDTRQFAIGFIRDDIGGDKLSADAIITICDSIRPEVQDLGKSLLHQQFREADAPRYLERLAEHPSTNLQLLVSTLLDRAFDFGTDIQKLQILVPYFATVLSQVNRGRVAKERVLALLRREAAKSHEAAAVLAPLLDRQSATAAITQKHPIIATMVDVHHLYPDVPLPISIIVPAPPAKPGALHSRPKGAS
ncbi:MAG TPA: hypothetical protein VFV99_16110 [Kofleriaceae bacterium]|nr:hypothetical protein [Kofleriaceae bacterium]